MSWLKRGVMGGNELSMLVAVLDLGVLFDLFRSGVEGVLLLWKS